MTEIESLINSASLYIQNNPKKTHLAHRLLYLAEQYSGYISDVTESSASHMLDILKEIYQICMKCHLAQVADFEATLVEEQEKAAAPDLPKSNKGKKKITRKSQVKT